jgi:hypothetical protein
MICREIVQVFLADISDDARVNIHHESRRFLLLAVLITVN